MGTVRRRERRGEVGASAVEYGLLVAGIAALIVLVVFAFGGVTKSLFSKSCASYTVKVAPSSAGSCDG